MKNNIWILVLFLYLGISILWSDFMGVSFKRWIRATGDLVMALVVLTEPAPYEAIKTLINRCAIVLIPLSLLFIKYFMLFVLRNPNSAVRDLKDGMLLIFK